MVALNFNGTIIWQVMATILLSGIKFLGVQIPFVMGFIEREENLKKKVALYILSALTILVRFSWVSAIKFGTSTVLLYSIINVFTALNFRRKNDLYAYLFVSVFFIDVVWCAFDGILIYDVIIALIKGISAVAGYVLFSKVEKLNSEITDKDFLYAISAVGLLLIGLQDVSLFSVNLRNVFGIYIVLMLASTNGIKYATIAGLLLGTINEISSPNMGVSIISLSLGGFIAGMFKNKNTMLQIWGFLLGNSILAYYIMGYNSLVMKYLEIVIASSLFYVSYKNKVTELITIVPEAIPLLVTNNNDAIKELEISSGSMFSVSELIDDFEIEEDAEMDIFDEIKEDICFSCNKYDECWDKKYDETSDEIFNVIEKLEDNEKIEEDNFLVMQSCDNGKEILNKITSKYESFKLSKKNEPFNALKQCVSNQFKGFSQYITQMKDKICEERVEDINTRIINAFEKEHIRISKLTVKNEDKLCEVSLKMEDDLPKVGFLLIANNILSRVLNKRMVISDEKKDLMIFRERNVLKVETEVISKKADSASIIGDSYKLVGNEENKYMAILSDGMGTGYEASKISSALVEMFCEMARTGINIGNITNMINTFMGYISKTEKIVTLDAISIDLLTGETEFIKVGSAPTFIIRNKEVEIIACDTLPLGIFDSVEFFEKNYNLEVGDIIVMVSDGVIDSKRNVINKEFWVSSFLRGLDISEPKVIAEELLYKTTENYEGDIKDDITIIVSRISE